MSEINFRVASEYELAVNEVQVPVLKRETCNLWITFKEYNVTDGMICAGYPNGGKDACQVSLKVGEIKKKKKRKLVSYNLSS